MSDKVRAKKILGQHFLTQPATAAKIVDALSAKESSLVLEIGPGMGILTRGLLEKYGQRLKVVEIDRESVEYLGEHFPELTPNILHQDFLEMELSNLSEGQIAVIGNFPYNISSQILFQVLKYRIHVEEVVGMFQREVARRIVSGPGSKEYGILSVLMGAFYHGEYLFTVGEHEFRPPPKVKSGVVRFTRKQDINLACRPETLFKVVKLAFNQRRKTLRNAMSSLWCSDLEATGFGSLRAEQLSVEQFVEMGRIVDEVMR
jgi:16S rRNA (adenine1518-N6/adenine1519-N6)-dimethyltransferase